MYRANLDGVNRLGILPLGDGGAPRLFDASRNNNMGIVSPDNRWIAHGSTESGRAETYVQSFPTPGGGKWQISSEGSQFSRWSPDGRELFYQTVDGRSIMAVPISGSTALSVGTAVPLFEPQQLLNEGRGGAGLRHQWDVAKDGRFLLNSVVEGGFASSFTVVSHWEAGIRK